MAAALLFFVLTKNNALPKYRMSSVISVVVMTSAFLLLFIQKQSWSNAYEFTGEAYSLRAGADVFTNGYRYLNWLIDIPMLLIQILFVAEIVGADRSRYMTRFAISGSLMILLGYVGQFYEPGRLNESSPLWSDDAPHAVVIGAGFGGMAAALQLRAKGYAVTVVDRLHRLGGRAQVFERGVAGEAVDTQIARQRLRAVIEMLLAGQSSDPIVADFLELAADARIPVAPAIELAKGVICDLSEVRIKDLSELHVYCYRVAGTVGLMMCGALGVYDPRSYPFAIDLGIAMQMTNIARDVREDAVAGRRYLPATLIGDVSPAELVDPNDEMKGRLDRVVESLLLEAEAYYQSGDAGLFYLPTRSRFGIRIASRVYRQIGVRLRRQAFAAWQGRVVVPLWEKLLVSLVALQQHVTPKSRHRHPVHRVHFIGLWRG